VTSTRTPSQQFTKKHQRSNSDPIFNSTSLQLTDRETQDELLASELRPGVKPPREVFQESVGRHNVCEVCGERIDFDYLNTEKIGAWPAARAHRSMALAIFLQVLVAALGRGGV
jgi:RNA polymerase-binding transcription factor DksA